VGLAVVDPLAFRGDLAVHHQPREPPVVVPPFGRRRQLDVGPSKGEQFADSHAGGDEHLDDVGQIDALRTVPLLSVGPLADGGAPGVQVLHGNRLLLVAWHRDGSAARIGDN
jgi:hypothetical protein